MRILVSSMVVGATLALCHSAPGQRPDNEIGQRADDAPGLRQPAEGQRGRGNFRPDDEPPPPGKAGPRNRPDDDQPLPGGRSGGRARSGGDEPRLDGPPSPRGGGGGGFGGRGPAPQPAPGRGPSGFGGEGGYGGFGGMRGGGYGGFGGGPGWMGMPGDADDPQMRELMRQDADMDRETRELAARVREARGEERNKIKSQLSDLVAKHFEVRQERRMHQLKRMEDELKRLRDTIAKRNSSRETIIDNHVKELVGDPRDLDF